MPCETIKLPNGMARLFAVGGEAVKFRAVNSAHVPAPSFAML